MSYEMVQQQHDDFSMLLATYVTPPELRIGWAGPEMAFRAFEMVGDQFQTFTSNKVTRNKTFRAWDVHRKVLNGADLVTYPQQTGDCVAVSLNDMIMAAMLLDIAAGDAEVFTRIYSSWLYYYSRVVIGKGQLGSSPGSVGSWAALASKVGGFLDSSIPGLPAYNRENADAMGNGKLILPAWANLAKPQHFDSFIMVEDWEQCCQLNQSGYLMTMASNIGFRDKPASDGFHITGGVIAHQMGIWATSDDERKPWVGIHNNWGDVHGQLFDFETGEPWPRGMMRWRPEQMEPAFRRGEVIAYSGLNGFPDRSEKFREFSML